LVTCSAIGGAFSFLVGGIDLPINSLLVLICLDYLTGIYAAWITNTLNYRIGINGLKGKVFIVVMVTLANLLDNSMGMGHTFRTMMIFGYGAMEGLSIFDNFDRIGWGQYVPAILRSKLIQLRDERGIK
jgi:toxin secretion/phage lysis holin